MKSLLNFVGDFEDIFLVMGFIVVFWVGKVMK